MDYITEIFNRANIQDIRELLLHGVEGVEYNPKGYKERIMEKEVEVNKMVRERYPELAEFDKVMGGIYSYVTAVEEVYMEVGLQCGFILATQIFSNNGKK